MTFQCSFIMFFVHLFNITQYSALVVQCWNTQWEWIRCELTQLTTRHTSNCYQLHSLGNTGTLHTCIAASATMTWNDQWKDVVTYNVRTHAAVTEWQIFLWYNQTTHAAHTTDHTRYTWDGPHTLQDIHHTLHVTDHTRCAWQRPHTLYITETTHTVHDRDHTHCTWHRPHTLYIT